MTGKLGPVSSLMPILECTTGLFGPWLDMRTNPPNGREGYIWVIVNEASQSIDEFRVLLLHAGYIKTLGNHNTYTHWKSSYLAVPDLPGVMPVTTTLSIDAALAAWRGLNPDYDPDDVPPDSFVEVFRVAHNNGFPKMSAVESAGYASMQIRV